MNFTTWLVSVLMGLVLAVVFIVGAIKFIEFISSPEQNPGYCVKIENKTVFVPHPGWNASDLTYEKKQVPYCVEWENYKP